MQTSHIMTQVSKIHSRQIQVKQVKSEHKNKNKKTTKNADC